MLRLKLLLLKCGITQDEFARRTGICRKHVGLCVNHGRWPRNKEDFMRRAERAVKTDPCLTAWLMARELDTPAIWDEVPDECRNHNPQHYRQQVAFVIGDPLEIKEREDTEMINPKARQHFKLFRDPFVNEISGTDDIFLSEDHRYLKAMMVETATNSGFMAAYGEVGCGKSVIRKAVTEELKREQIKIIFPMIVDKNRVTPSSLVDAIVMDISEEKPRLSLEQKTRQALRLLKNRAASGQKQVLIIEEAHLLPVKTMKSLKQIAELEDGFERLVGIILIGQSELEYLLDESVHPEMREVIRRITCAPIKGIGKDTGKYIEHKFARINAKAQSVFAKGAFTAIEKRLQDKNGRRKPVSKAYPLSINNLAAKAINLAAEMGEEKVTDEVVMGVS